MSSPSISHVGLPGYFTHADFPTILDLLTKFDVRRVPEITPLSWKGFMDMLAGTWEAPRTSSLVQQ